MSEIHHCHREECATTVDALKQRIAELEVERNATCNCRWDGETQTRQCELHAAHVEAIHEWANRAKTAEQRIAELESCIKQALIELIETGTCYDTLQKMVGGE